MNTLLKVLAGITLGILLVLPMTGVFASCQPGDPTRECDNPGTAPTDKIPGCSTDCKIIPPTGTTGTNAIGGIEPDKLPEWTADEVIKLVAKIINWIFTFLMIFVVIMVVISGFLFVTGGGNPDNVTKARNTLMFALVGFAVGMLAKGLIALVQAFLNKTIEKGGLVY